MASYHAEVRRRQALLCEMGSTAPPVVGVKFDGDIPRRPRRHTVDSVDRVPEAPTDDERLHGEGKPSFWRSAAPRLPGGLSLLRRSPRGDDSVKAAGGENKKSDAGVNATEPPINTDRRRKMSKMSLLRSQGGEDLVKAAGVENKMSDAGVNALEPPIDTDRQRKMSKMSLLSSSRKIRDSRMYQNLQNLRKNSTVSRIRAHVLDHSDSVHKKSWDEPDSLSTVILTSLSKACLCDVMIVGRDKENPVGTPSYLLAAHSDVFLDMLYSNSTHPAENANAPPRPRKAKASFAGFLDMLYDSDSADAVDNVNSPPSPHKVKIPFAGRDAIEGSIHFLATRSLPAGHEDESSEANLRCICQVYLIGRIYKIASLTNHAYRAACRLMNKIPCLVCAVFDEFIESTKLLPSNLKPPSSRDELKDFVLE